MENIKKFIFNKGNLPLLSLYLILSLISIVSIFLSEYSNNDFSFKFLKQLLFFIISFFIIYSFQKIDIEKIEKLSFIFYILSISLLILLLVSPETIAPVTNGAKAWFNFGFFTLQPSEFAKISTILMISFIIKQEHFFSSSDSLKLIKLSIIIFLPLFLIIKENDTGNGLFFIALFLLLSFLVSSRSKTFLTIYSVVIVFLTSIILAALYLPVFLDNLGFHTYQLKRIQSWLTPQKFTLDFSYQINLVLNEISKGSWTGNFEKNTQYIPEQFNDFIFSVIAKHFGFMGSVIFIFIYFLFLFLILRLVRKCQRGNFSYYLSLLTVFTFAFPFVINTYSSTGLIPVIGVSLPFISYGGSSLIANSILFAFVLKIHNTIYQEYLEDDGFTEFEDEFFEEDNYNF